MSKFVFFSNYLNHHQLPLCKELVKLTNNDFIFVSQKAISEKRIGLGYKDISNDYDFNLKTYESNEKLDKAYKIVNEADVVLFGASNLDYIKQRLKDNKITIKISERLFRNKITIFNYLRSFHRVYKNHTKYKNKELYMLCNGAYAAYDFARFGAYKNKMYKWAYFTECKKYNINELMANKNKSKLSILWVGRFIELKHPEMFIELAKRLKGENYDFIVNVIGNGELEETIKENIKNNELENYINLLGPMSPDEVRKNMELGNIFIFTSDYREGWGAVVNEAMNSGCACVCTHAVGSTTHLIKHNKNGLIFESGNFHDFYDKVKYLIDNKDKREEMGINAYKTITELWNAEVAAKRLLELAKCLQEGKDTPYLDGPCSKAIPISDEDMYDYLINNKL